MKILIKKKNKNVSIPPQVSSKGDWIDLYLSKTITIGTWSTYTPTFRNSDEST